MSKQYQTIKHLRMMLSTVGKVLVSNSRIFSPFRCSQLTSEKKNRRLGGGAQRPNREIVSFRSCVRARGDCQVEMSLKRKTPGFPFSLLAKGGFPFSLGILPLLPSCYPALAGLIGMTETLCGPNISICSLLMGHTQFS